MSNPRGITWGRGSGLIQSFNITENDRSEEEREEMEFQRKQLAIRARKQVKMGENGVEKTHSLNAAANAGRKHHEEETKTVLGYICDALGKCIPRWSGGRKTLRRRKGLRNRTRKQ